MNWIVENPFVLSMNLHDGATVACYPFDDFYSLANDNLKEKIKQFANNEKNHNNISYSPDHELVVHMASKYAQNNPLMKVYFIIQCRQTKYLLSILLLGGKSIQNSI